MAWFRSLLTGEITSVSILTYSTILLLMTSEISGFYFLEAESNFKPEQELLDFLSKGDAPIYIG
jgi:hypothetical protein